MELCGCVVFLTLLQNFIFYGNLGLISQNTISIDWSIINVNKFNEKLMSVTLLILLDCRQLVSYSIIHIMVLYYITYHI